MKMTASPLPRLHSLLLAAVVAGAFTSLASAQITVTTGSDTTVTSDFPTTPQDASTTLGMTQINNGDYQAYPFIKFDLSAYAGETVSGDGALTLRFLSAYDAGFYPHAGDNLVLKALPSAFDATTTYSNYAGFTTGGIFTRVDIDGFTSIGGPQNYDFGAGTTTAQNMTFIVPQATLQSWIDTPASNFGFALFRAPTESGDYLDQSALSFSSFEGVQAPSLSFSVSTSAVPEPSSYAAFAGLGMLGFAVCRRRRPSAGPTTC